MSSRILCYRVASSLVLIALLSLSLPTAVQSAWASIPTTKASLRAVRSPEEDIPLSALPERPTTRYTAQDVPALLERAGLSPENILPAATLEAGGSYQWHTFYGTSEYDAGSGIVIDSSGSVFVAGYSDASWNGPTGQLPLHPYSGSVDAFVLKLSPTGAYQWHTFYGGSGDDRGYGIATDSSGSVVVTGNSEVSWDGPTGQPPMHLHSGGSSMWGLCPDAFVLKLSSAGAYEWHTFYGSSDWEDGNGTAIDSSGNVYITGTSGVSWDGPAGQPPLHPHAGGYDSRYDEYYSDAFVLKLSPAGAYQWHTFYGRFYSDDRGYGIAIDKSASVVVSGYGSASWDGPNGSPPLHTGSSTDAFVLKLSPAGAYEWHTFYGSGDPWVRNGTALDGSGNVYITGVSGASWGGPAGQLPLHPYSGDDDAFVLKLSSAGAYQWHTFYGGSDDDRGLGLAIDGSGSVYVTGDSYASWDGPSGHPPLHPYSGSWTDAFVLKLSPAGAYEWHTFYGSSDWEVGNGAAIDSSGTLYITGKSGASWDGPAGQPPLHPYSGENDAFVLKLGVRLGFALLSPPRLDFGASLSSMTLTVNTEDPSDAWSLSESIPWLSLSRSSGTGTSTVAATVDRPGLPEGAYTGVINGVVGGETAIVDVSMIVVDTSEGAYRWHTFYGGNSTDDGYAITTDSSGGVYVTGTSWASWDGPADQQALHAYSGDQNVFVLKLSSAGAYEWHTFYDGSSYGHGSIAIDSSGCVYVTGGSPESWAGPAGQAPLRAYSGNQDAFVLKLSPAGAYQWHAFYGGGEDDNGRAVAIDGSGSVVVSGSSDASWDGQPPLHAYSGNHDAFVLKLSSAGAYQWHTFYGGSDEDYGDCVEIDGSGSVVVIGVSYASWDGSTGQPPLRAYGAYSDAFVLKLSPGGAYQWHTFYGGSDYDAANDIVVDSSGGVVVTGYSEASWSGPTGQLPLRAYSALSDAFVLKLSPAGAYQWHTFIGSSDYDGGSGVAVDSSGGAYVAGWSHASWSGPTGQPPLRAYSATNDAFVLKLSPVGAYQWHTFYGGSDNDYGGGIALDSSGRVYVTGNSYASWDGPTGQPPLHPYSDFNDAFVLRLGVPPISPTDLDFGASLTSLTATINTGDANGAWSVSESIPWLSLSSGSGTGAATVTATVDRAGLPKGVYTGTIDAVVGGEAVTVDVSMWIAHQVYLPLVQRGNH